MKKYTSLNFFIFAAFIYMLFMSSCYVYKPYEPKFDEEGKEIPAPTTKERLQQNKMFKIEVAEKVYKVRVQSWEKDSLVAEKFANPSKIIRFHEQDIQNIRDRRFQSFFTNGVTILAYGLIAVGVILIL